MGDVVVVVGAEGSVGSALVERLRGDEQVERVVAIGRIDDRADAGPRPAMSAGAPVTWLDPRRALLDLERVFAGATTVVHLGSPASMAHDVPPPADGTGNHADVRLARAVLDAASAAGVRHVVVLSSAMVYGGWANNQVPLTEDATLRPAPGVPYAIALGEIERSILDWRDENPGVSVAVLRPTVTVSAAGAGESGALDRSPWVPLRWQAGDVGPPVQFLLHTDLAAALAHVCHRRLDGPFNVAPEGWIPSESLPELAGPMPQVRVPPAVADALTAARLRRAGYPPEVAAYLHHPWVVASDRLRATGWLPTDTNEEAFVGAYDGGPFASMDAHRRQTLSLGAVALSAAAVVAVAVAFLRRRSRR